MLLGFPSGSVDISIMVDLKNTLMDKYKYSESLSSDITSSTYMFANLLGDSLGPLYGGFVTYKYGFEVACILTGLLNAMFCIMFGMIYKDLFTFKENTLDTSSETDDGKEPNNLGYVQLENAEIKQ